MSMTGMFRPFSWASSGSKSERENPLAITASGLSCTALSQAAFIDSGVTPASTTRRVQPTVETASCSGAVRATHAGTEHCSQSMVLPFGMEPVTLSEILMLVGRCSNCCTLGWLEPLLVPDDEAVVAEPDEAVVVEVLEADFFELEQAATDSVSPRAAMVAMPRSGLRL